MAHNSHLVEERLAEAVSEYVDLLNSGSVPALDLFVKQHADVGEKLRPLLEAANRFALAIASIQPTGNDDAAFNTVQGMAVAADERRALRAAVEAGTAEIAVTQRSDVLLLLLRAVGEIWGKTKLVKLTFLTLKETRASSRVPDYFQHVAYDYGPFDAAVYRDIDALAAHGLVDARPPAAPAPGQRQVDAVYRLTLRGKKYAEALARAERSAPGLIQDLQSIARKYGQLSLDDLLHYVYENYLEYTTESKIRDQVLGKREPEKKH